MSGNTHLPSLRSRLVALATLALLAAAALAASACSSSSSEGSKKPPPSESPEDVKVPLAQVITEMPKMVGHGNDAAAAAASGDFAEAQRDAAAMSQVWHRIEGTVRDRNSDIYVSLEDAQDAIERGVNARKASQVASAAKEQARLVQSFLAANPA